MTGMMQRTITKAVMDAEPLVNAMILELVRRSPEQRRKSILEKSRLSWHLKQSSSRQQAFMQLFGSISMILTTTHVIAEVQGLYLKRESQREFWDYGMQMLSVRGLDEKRAGLLLDIHKTDELREGICTGGPTDTGLIELARQEGCTLLTHDAGTLYPRALALDVDCRLVQHLIP